LADVVAAGLICLLGVFLLGWSGSHALGRTLLVRDASGDVIALELADARTLSVEGLKGDTVIEIARGAARFVSSPCPHKTCIKRGTISRSGEWIACVPNGIFATVKGETEYDGVTP